MENLELLRVTLDKHEIAGERQLKAPLEMTTYDQTKVYIYAKNDPQRSHIMPTGITARGSLVWQAIDGRTSEARWIDRRSLSNRMITVWESNRRPIEVLHCRCHLPIIVRCKSA